MKCEKKKNVKERDEKSKKIVIEKINEKVNKE